MLARTSKAQPNHDGLSMFLVPKARGTAEVPFPDEGLSGSEVRALGYRGMKEYELSFDGYRVGPEGLLGGVPGMGFKQLMATLETARINNAARAGVAQDAWSRRCANTDRSQFGPPSRLARVAPRAGNVTRSPRRGQLTGSRPRQGQRRRATQRHGKALRASASGGRDAHALTGHGYARRAPLAPAGGRGVFALVEGTSEIQAEVVGGASRAWAARPPLRCAAAGSLAAVIRKTERVRAHLSAAFPRFARAFRVGADAA